MVILKWYLMYYSFIHECLLIGMHSGQAKQENELFGKFWIIEYLILYIVGIVNPDNPDELPPDKKPWTTLAYGNGPGYDWGFRINPLFVDTSEYRTFQMWFRGVKFCR